MATGKCVLGQEKGVQVPRCPTHCLERLAIACGRLSPSPRLLEHARVGERQFTSLMVDLGVDLAVSAFELGAARLTPPQEWATGEDGRDALAVYTYIARHLSEYGVRER